jgi:ATP-dependent helicase/nuclease subunit B
MPVRWIIGRSGSGKTLHCHRAIIEMMRADPLGPPIWLVVPKQETFTAERELTCGSGLRGFTRTRVVSFEMLGEQVLAEVGGTAIPQVTELGRQMVIGHLLRRHQGQLKFYASTARQVGLAAELDATFAEIERAGRTVEDLSQAIDQLQGSPSGAQVAPLIDKLHDLRLLYAQYTLYLGQERLDPQRRLEYVLAALDRCRRIQGSTVFVDGFIEFTDFERRMLAGLSKACTDVQITLLVDPHSPVLANRHLNPDELALCHKTESTYKRLCVALDNAQVLPGQVLRLDSVVRFSSPALRHIERHLFAPRGVVCESADGIELIEAPDRRGEVDAAARHVRKLLDAGLRFRDIAVLMRSLDDYHELIDASFREHDIPYFIDRRRPAVHHPLLQFTRAVLQIALHDWPHDAVMTLLKTELAGLHRDEVDELENYVLLHRIRGSAWAEPEPWTFRRKLTRAESDEPLESERVDAARMNATRLAFVQKLIPFVQLLNAAATPSVRDLVAALFNVFEQFEVRQRLRRWMDEAAQAGRIEQRDEHARVWGALIELLDELVDVIPDEQVGASDFVDVLETGLERFSLALTPPTMDQVLVGAVDRTRSPRPRAVVLLGMNDNQFPRLSSEGSILSDEERQKLSDLRMDLDPDSRRQLLDERLLGYIAFTRASERLCLARSIADDQNRPQSPSPFWVDLRRMFPALKPHQVPRDARGHPECIGTPRQLVTSLMQWVRSDAGEPATSTSSGDPWPSLYHWMATYQTRDDSIDRTRFLAWRALSYSNEAKLSDDVRGRLFPSPLHASVSRIESFAACPFKHFAQYGLRLQRREEPQVTSLDLGNACHGILEKIVGHMLRQKAGWDEPDPALISGLARQVGQELRGELMLSSAHNQYLLKRIEKTIGRVVLSQSAAAKRGRLTPWRAELVFGRRDSELPALELKTPGGNRLLLNGKIDRVDVLQGQSVCAVIDYKLSDNALALDWVYHGLSLQLLTYLLVLQELKQLTPAAALYVQLLRRLETVKHPDEATAPDDPTFDLKIKPRGIIDWKHRKLLDAQHNDKSSDVFNLFITKEGELGRKKQSDGCESPEFAALLKRVRHTLGQLADQIVAGQIDVAPYRIGECSPCHVCEFRNVCRFDAAVNRYRQLEKMDRQRVLAKVIEEEG